jgi:cell division protein FtsB
VPFTVRPLAAQLHERVAAHAQTASRAFSGSILSLFLGLVMLLLIGLLLSNFVGQVIQGARLEDQRAALAAEVAALEAQNATLRGAVEFAESDVSVERIAREQLGYAREGDIVLLPQLPTAAPPALAPPAAPVELLPAEAAAAAPNWARWWGAFFPASP